MIFPSHSAERTVQEFQRRLGLAVGWLSFAIVAMTVMFGCIVLRLAQLGPYADQALGRLVPLFLMGFGCELFLFLVAAFFWSSFVARRLSEPLDEIEKEVDAALREKSLPRFQTASRDAAFQALARKLNQVVRDKG